MTVYIARVTLSILRNSKAGGIRMAGGGGGVYRISKRWNPVERSDIGFISCYTTGYKGNTGLLLLPERAVNVIRLSQIG